jgi:hypothetical protein
MNKLGQDRADSRYYTLVFNGQSYDLVRDVPRTTPPSLTDPTNWEWRSTDESFIRVRAESNGVSSGTRGGYNSGGAMPRYKWQVWTKDGTRFDFEEDAWQGWLNCGDVSYNYMEAYKWYLTRVVDTHGNTIDYSYGRASHWDDTHCFQVQGTIDWDVWPTEIQWGALPPPIPIA